MILKTAETSAFYTAETDSHYSCFQYHGHSVIDILCYADLKAFAKPPRSQHFVLELSSRSETVV